MWALWLGMVEKQRWPIFITKSLTTGTQERDNDFKFKLFKHSGQSARLTGAHHHRHDAGLLKDYTQQGTAVLTIQDPGC
jgi:hypothetical protein